MNFEHGGKRPLDRSFDDVPRPWISSLSLSVVVLGFLWSGIIRTDGTPAGDGSRLFTFIEFVRGSAHRLAFWNPFRNGGYPLFADPEHCWLLSLFVDPASANANLEFNLALFAVLVSFAVPTWLICRRLSFSPFWTIVLVATVGFSERLIWMQQSGRFEFLVAYVPTLLIIVWILLSERLRPWHYVLLVVCVAIAIEEVVQKAVLHCLVIYTGLLLQPDPAWKQPWRKILDATASAAAISLAGLCLSAVWSLPLIAWFSSSHTPISALTYAANIPQSALDYGRMAVPFIPADSELASFTSLILIPALLLLGLARPSASVRRAVMMGIPIYLWALIFVAMSVPFVGPAIQSVYSIFPLIAGMRWFAPLGLIVTMLLTIGAVWHLSEL